MLTNEKDSIKPWELDTCPVTGLPVTTKSEWTDIDLGEGYSVTFCLIGDRILLYIQPLIEYSNNLYAQAQSYNVDEVERVIAAFPELIAKIKENS